MVFRIDSVGQKGGKKEVRNFAQKSQKIYSLFQQICTHEMKKNENCKKIPWPLATLSARLILHTQSETIAYTGHVFMNIFISIHKLSIWKGEFANFFHYHILCLWVWHHLDRTRKCNWLLAFQRVCGSKGCETETNCTSILFYTSPF